MIPPKSELLPDLVHFGDCEVLVVERQLRIGGRPVVIGSRAFDVLVDLLAHRDRLVTKNELLDRVWAGLVVEENNLPTQVSTLRKLLGAHVIATIPGRGYRFSAVVASDEAEPGRVVGSAAAVAAAADAGSPVRPKTNLPASRPQLIGRDADLLALEELVGAQRVVTVAGGGGAGKTRLTLALAWQQRDRYRHGVCWVGLAATSDPAALCSVVADALGVDLGAGEPLPNLLSALRPLDLLLVLDNAEHLREAVAALVATVDTEAPQVRVVVTSQVPLRIAAERVFRLRDLEVPPTSVTPADALRFGAVALFVDRAAAADSRFSLRDDNVAAVVSICRSLHGLALALELAAARVSMLGVARLADSLDQRLRLLTEPVDRDVPARQQTLRAALEWSHALLDDAAKAVFRRLGVLTGTASLELLQALANDGDDPADSSRGLDLLSDLVDRSFVELVPADDDSVLPRYRLLESPRLYALERLDEAGETSATRERHAAVMTRLFADIYPRRWDGSILIERWQALLRADIGNGRAAFAWACGTGDASSALILGTTLLHALPWSWQAERTAIADACRLLLANESVPDAIRLDAARAICRFALGSRALEMRDLALWALTLARRLGDRFGLYAAASHLACAEARLGHVEATEAALLEMRSLEDPAWPAQRLGLGADAEYLAGRTDPARVLALTRRQMALSRASGSNAWLPLLNLVDAELSAGNAQAAASYGDELLGLLHHSRDERGLAYALLNLTSVKLALDDVAGARGLAEAGWPLGSRFDLQAYWGDVLSLLAVREKRPRQAARLAGFADARYRQHQEARLGNEAKASDLAVTACRAVLGEVDFERLRGDGETLVDADIARLAFAPTDG